jgi:DNA-binding response OmpR family regulator
MSNPRVLMVDDNEDILAAFSEGLTNKGFDVITAPSVPRALRLIADETFDVLLTDLHMPNPGDGFTLVTAMRHTHPQALTMVVSGYPALPEAVTAILLEADQVIPKPVSIASLAELIKTRLSKPIVRVTEKIETVATVLEREVAATIQHWLVLVEKSEEVACVKLTSAQRMGHLPNLIADLVERLRLPRTERALNSVVAQKHGQLRLAQRYTVPMVVEESRLLQVSVFNTLHTNLRSLDFSTVLLDVMSIADEIDSQLKQALHAFTSGKSANTVG